MLMMSMQWRAHKREQQRLLDERNQQAEFLKEQIKNQAAIMARQEEEAKQREQEYRRQIEDLRRESTAQFKALSAEMLKEQTQAMRSENARQIDAVIKPLAENIESFRKAVNDSYMQENAARTSLSDRIDRLMKLNETLGLEARNLSSALKGNHIAQGNWGEMILTSLLEQAGLEEGIHFQTQVTRDEQGNILRDEEGSRQRPDVIVYLPDNRKIIIDSKTSLTAYIDATAMEPGAAQKQRLQNHVQSVMAHINELASKSYQKTVKDSADYVMMFIPNEGAYLAAVHAEPRLWQTAFDRGVVLASPTHLFSVMHIISQLWVQDKQNRSTLEIARKGASLYDKVMGFMDAFEDVGSRLDKAQESFNLALQRLATGKGNIAKLSQDLKQLGIKSEKNLPPRTSALLSDE